ncbi:MAG: RDD family protein [Oligoflexales bacterium]
MKYLKRFRPVKSRKPIRGVKLFHDIEIDYRLYHPASPRSRVLAFVIDFTFQVSLVRLFQAIFSAYVQQKIAWAIHNPQLFADICAFAAIVAYTFYPLYSSGQTLGKKALGIRVVRSNYRGDLSILSIFLRELVGKPIALVSLFLGFFMILLNSEHRGFHDYLSSSRVISYRLPRRLSKRSGIKV